MYKKNIYKVRANSKVAAKTFRMVLEGDTQYFTAPGQFVNIAITGKFLRRPISVCDYDDDSFTLLYDVVGSGTEIMSHAQPGDTFDILTGLGNGFDLNEECCHPLLIGGGIGVAPLFRLAKDLMAKGVMPDVALGFNSAQDVSLADEFAALGLRTEVSTADGSMGVKGFVTQLPLLADTPHDYYYACGPMPMLRAVGTMMQCRGELSLEERMGCGFGACVCCSVETKGGAKRVCKEGPVFKSDELIWK